MKKQRVSTGIKIDSITPYVTSVTLPNGETRIVYDTITLEELYNMEKEYEWTKAQLAWNRRSV